MSSWLCLPHSLPEIVCSPISWRTSELLLKEFPNSPLAYMENFVGEIIKSISSTPSLQSWDLVGSHSFGRLRFMGSELGICVDFFEHIRIPSNLVTQSD